MAWTRRDIWSLEDEQEWHPVTEAYARAVGVMKTRSPDDVTSWRFQAAIHASSTGDWRQQCQHNCWFFLPWHRAYLYWWERIVRAAMSEIPEIDPAVADSWALPYWDYSRGGRFATLPPAFRSETLQDGVTENPLFEPSRKQRINDGEELLADAIATKRALEAGAFVAQDGGFGGAATGRNHLDQDPARRAGRVERTPHNDVHNGVGGLMMEFDTAGLDPVFWMHHANIDRLWAVWVGQGHANPPDDRWATTEFEFHDERKQRQTSTAAGVLDTSADLEYTYEDLTVPAAVADAARAAMNQPMPPEHPPERVGAAPVELTGTRVSVAFPVEPPSGPAAARAAEEAGPERVYLDLEGIEGERNPGVTYRVYVNLGDDEEPGAEAEPHYVGNVSFFGIEKSRDVRSDHPTGHGLRYTFDITETAADLRARDRWDPTEVKVTFAPLEEEEVVGEAAAQAPIRVRSVGLSVQ